MSFRRTASQLLCVVGRANYAGLIPAPHHKQLHCWRFRLVNLLLCSVTAASCCCGCLLLLTILGLGWAHAAISHTMMPCMCEPSLHAITPVHRSLSFLEDACSSWTWWIAMTVRWCLHCMLVPHLHQYLMLSVPSAGRLGCLADHKRQARSPS